MSFDSDSLNVLMATPRYLPLIGGVESHVHEVGRRLAAAGGHVTVLTTDRTGCLPTDEECEGVRIRRVRAWPANKDYYLAPDIYRTIVDGKWDVVHCQGCHTFVPPTAMLAARHAKIPYVVTFHSGGHSSRVRNALRGIQWTALRPLFAGADALVGVSEFEARLFQKRFRLPRERFVVIPNGGRLPETAGLCPKSDKRKLIVSVGRLERYKGHQRAITALPQVLEQEPEARLLILGSGPFESELYKIAQHAGVADRVEIRSVPASNRREMACLLLEAALVVLLSEYEAQSIAVMEALTLRRPVLVADTSALSEFADHGWAESVPLLATPEEIARGILRQLRHPLVATDVALPTWDDCADQLLSLYHRVAGRVPCAS